MPGGAIHQFYAAHRSMLNDHEALKLTEAAQSGFASVQFKVALRLRLELETKRGQNGLCESPHSSWKTSALRVQ